MVAFSWAGGVVTRVIRASAIDTPSSVVSATLSTPPTRSSRGTCSLMLMICAVGTTQTPGPKGRPPESCKFGGTPLMTMTERGGIASSGATLISSLLSTPGLSRSWEETLMVAEDFRPCAEACGQVSQKMAPQPSKKSVVSQRTALGGGTDDPENTLAKAASPLR